MPMPVPHELAANLPTKRPQPEVRSEEYQPPPPIMRCPSEESIPTELCDGPVPEGEGREDGLEGVVEDGSRPSSPAMLKNVHGQRLEISDRVELMERIKRGESPTWVPNRMIETRLQHHDSSPPWKAADTKKSPLLPAAELRQTHPTEQSNEDETLSRPEDIQRPRSALHSGDFTQQLPPQHRLQDVYRPAGPFGPSGMEGLSSSPPAPWAFQSPYYVPSSLQITSSSSPFQAPRDSTARSRAPSLSSLSSSFVYKPPTSPLVQASSNNDNDLDLSPTTSPLQSLGTAARNPWRSSHTRRRLSSSQSSPPGQLPIAQQAGRPPPSMRRETSLPYQAHQPRRSMSSIYSLQHSSCSPQTPPMLRSRRPSLSSEISPLQHASMVGSYEESILRGRMSTTPSKPLNFMAQIGVLGKGKCRANLRCPAHVSVPFPAVFYSYGKANAGRVAATEDHPSPYVGLVDLENSLSKPNELRDEERPRKTQSRPSGDHLNPGLEDVDFDPQAGARLSDQELRRREKKKRRSTSPKAPPGGSYRIPEKGQLQIVIKNPNKTAVKLFLVPYDLEGMESGTKTFIRQRSYSAGPIIDIPPNLQGDISESAKSPKERQTLRYLIHLHICCPSKGLFYLYKSIRVVFANRVPDGKENLRNEIQLPEPRYSAYKPSRESINAGLPSTSATPAIDRNTYRRRSSGSGLYSGQGFQGFPSLDGIGEGGSASSYPHFGGQSSPRVEPVPFSLSHASHPPLAKPDNMDIDERPSTKESNETTSNPLATSPSMQDSWMSSSSNSSGTYGKLRKGDVGYGGNAFISSSDGSESGEGLLARKLKKLDVQKELERRDRLER